MSLRYLAFQVVPEVLVSHNDLESHSHPEHLGHTEAVEMSCKQMPIKMLRFKRHVVNNMHHKLTNTQPNQSETDDEDCPGYLSGVLTDRS